MENNTHKNLAPLVSTLAIIKVAGKETALHCLP